MSAPASPRSRRRTRASKIRRQIRAAATTAILSGDPDVRSVPIPLVWWTILGEPERVMISETKSVEVRPSKALVDTVKITPSWSVESLFKSVYLPATTDLWSYSNPLVKMTDKP